MKGGPWLFRGAPVWFQKSRTSFLTSRTTSSIKYILVWARIHVIPERLTKKKELAEKVDRRVGEPPITMIVDEVALTKHLILELGCY